MDEIKWKLDKSKSWTDLHNFIKPGINIDIEATKGGRAEAGVNDLHGSLNVGHFRYGNKYGSGGRSESRDLADGRHHFLSSRGHRGDNSAPRQDLALKMIVKSKLPSTAVQFVTTLLNHSK